jgi:hypothetical protein
MFPDIPVVLSEKLVDPGSPAPEFSLEELKLGIKQRHAAGPVQVRSGNRAVLNIHRTFASLQSQKYGSHSGAFRNGAGST